MCEHTGTDSWCEPIHATLGPNLHVDRGAGYNMLDLVKAVRDHAQAHYNDGGWDVVVECYSDAEIVKIIVDHPLLDDGPFDLSRGATTPEEAIACFADVVDVYTDRQAYTEYEQVMALGQEDYRRYRGEPRWHKGDGYPE